MNFGAAGPRMRWTLQSGGRAGRAVLASLYTSPLYRWRFGRGRVDRLLLAPQDLRAADPTRAEELAGGTYSFAGKSVTVTDTSPFAIVPPSSAWRETLLGFTWLRHLRAADTAQGRLAARALVGDFVRSPARFGRDALAPTVTARRVLSWLSQAPLALDGADRGFYRAFTRSIAWQARYLLSAGRVGPDGLPRLLCAVAAAQASLCLADAALLRRLAVSWLAQELDRQVLPDGVHVSRNPQAILELLLDLLPLRQSFAARNISPPPELLGAIDRMMPMLRFFRHADGALATFNGMGPTQPHLVATLLAYDDARGRPVQNAPHGGYQRAEAAGTVLLVDTGRSPPVSVSQEAHAGTLALEVSADGCRLFVNCGAPAPGRESWRHAARQTAAHCTAGVSDASSCRFAPASDPQASGQAILSGPRRVEVERREAAGGVSLALRHDGYRPAFGLVHARELHLDPNGRLTGTDAALDRAGRPWRGTQPVILRFHTHPAVIVRPMEGDTAANLVLPNGAAWVFRLAGGLLAIEESVHLANPEGPRRTAQIVASLPRQRDGTHGSLSWSLAPA